MTTPAHRVIEGQTIVWDGLVIDVTAIEPGLDGFVWITGPTHEPARTRSHRIGAQELVEVYT
jgi:hypothetical protein